MPTDTQEEERSRVEALQVELENLLCFDADSEVGLVEDGLSGLHHVTLTEDAAKRIVDLLRKRAAS